MSGVNWIELPPAQRAVQYREQAEEMRSRAAGAASEEMRRAYLKMAVEWLDMADEVEADYCKVSVTVEAPELAALLSRRSRSNGAP